MILAGGPDPRHGGEIRTMGYHSAKNQHGLTFGKAYPAYKDAILKPYSTFLHQVYSKSQICSKKSVSLRLAKPQRFEIHGPWLEPDLKATLAMNSMSLT